MYPYRKQNFIQMMYGFNFHELTTLRILYKSFGKEFILFVKELARFAVKNLGVNFEKCITERRRLPRVI